MLVVSRPEMREVAIPKQIMSKAIGIDLGTTNSAVAVLNPTDTQIVIHKNPKTKRETTPSCVWKDPRSGEIVVGVKAYARLGSTPAPIRPIRRSMGRQSRAPVKKWERMRLTEKAKIGRASCRERV